jgi:hypothetical protein
MLFHYDKLYADLVGPDGTLCVAYVARLRLAGLVFDSAGVELYTPDGARTVRRARSTPSIESCLGDGALHVALELENGRFDLRHTVRAGRWRPPSPRPSPHLQWTVEVARADARAEWSGNGAPPTLIGTGYADRVTLRRPPRALGISRLRWGRVHLPHATIVFNALEQARGASWRRALYWPEAEEPCGWGDVDVAGDDVHTRLTWPAASSLAPLHLRRARVLHEGAALDGARFPSRAERWLTQALSGPLRETRQLSRVESGAFAPAWALHETVAFGAASASSVPSAAGARLLSPEPPPAR